MSVKTFIASMMQTIGLGMDHGADRDERRGIGRARRIVSADHGALDHDRLGSGRDRRLHRFRPGAAADCRGLDGDGAARHRRRRHAAARRLRLGPAASQADLDCAVAQVERGQVVSLHQTDEVVHPLDVERLCRSGWVFGHSFTPHQQTDRVRPLLAQAPRASRRATGLCIGSIIGRAGLRSLLTESSDLGT